MLPDLRLAKALDKDGTRTCFARFTLKGETVTVDETGDDADDKVVRRVATMLRDSFGVPAAPAMRVSRGLEREVIAAAASGNTEEADRLARELVMHNARQPRMLLARAPSRGVL